MDSGSTRAADTDDSSPIVRAEDVTKRYTRGTTPGFFGRLLGRREPPTVTALEDVSLSIDAGEIVAISGPSGSGKSTLLHHLAGLEVPDTGTVTIRGQSTSSLSRKRRTRLRLEQVGIVFQHFHLVESLSARANVALPLVELGVPTSERKRRATDLLERVDLGDRLDHRPGELSGGEQQRVAIARALVTDPALVIADEPTGELDSETGQRVLETFQGLTADHAVVLASHDQSALAIGDRRIRLQDGSIVEGTDTAETHDQQTQAKVE